MRGWEDVKELDETPKNRYANIAANGTNRNIVGIVAIVATSISVAAAIGYVVSNERWRQQNK